MIVSWIDIVLHTILAISIVFMGIVIGRSNKLMDILKDSTAEPLWKRTRISLILLTALYIIIMVIFLVSENDNQQFESFHFLIMNTAFLLTSIMLLNLVNLDIKAFSSLFELIKDEE